MLDQVRQRLGGLAIADSNTVVEGEAEVRQRLGGVLQLAKHGVYRKSWIHPAEYTKKSPHKGATISTRQSRYTPGPLSR